jgi:1-deoxy-D-xylulose-5-phosphate synthase
VMHAEREEQLAEVGLDVAGIIRSAVAVAQAVGLPLPELGVEADSDRNCAHAAGPQPAAPALSAKS